jgi:hypothetical protein
MRTPASLHRDDKGWHGLRERWNALRSHALPLHDRSGSIRPAEAATVLSQINAENRDPHWHAFLPVAQPTWLEKRGGYPIKFWILKAALPDNIVLLPLPA